MRLRTLALAIPMLLLAADSPPIPTSPARILQWDAVTTNADGTPCTDLAGYVVAISDPTTDLSSGGTALMQIQCAVPEQAIAPLVALRPAGLYRLWARAFDLAGNVGAWSDPLLVAIDPIAPGKPGGLKVKVTVIVEVGG